MKTQTSIVWVYGGSAAGKETFIRTLVEKQPEGLLKRLNWSGRRLVSSRKSIEFIAQYAGDPVGERREEILEEVSKLAKAHPGAVVLIKGQDLDLKKLRQRRLKAMIPEAEHRIIYLHGDADEHFERWQRKSWYHPSYTKDTVQTWLKRQMQLLMPLKEEFGIIAFDGGASKNYTPKKFP